MAIPSADARPDRVGDTNAPGLLPAQVAAAYNAGASSVTINPGAYIMPDGEAALFNFDHWTNFTIHAFKTLFIVGTNGTFVFNNCSNVTLRGATVRPKTYPFTQGRVTQIDLDARGNVYADWRISAGYSTNIQWWFNAVDGVTRQVRLEAGDIWYDAKTAEFLGGQTWRLHFPGRTLPFATNDWLVARSGAQGFAFFLNRSRNCFLEDLVSQSGWFSTYHEFGGGGNHMIRCRIQPAPTPPPGGTEPPIVGCGLDGVHTVATHPGLHMEDCVFDGVFLDDNIAIHGSFQTVASSSGNTVVFNSRAAGFEFNGRTVFDSREAGFEAGSPVRISNENGFFGQGICTALTTLTNGMVQLTLDRSLNPPVGARGSNPKLAGAGYRIINCRLGNTRSRAIIAKADDGIIAGCTIENAQSGIQIGPEYYWSEADYAWNITITSNIIRNCGRFGIHVFGNGAMGNRNLRLENNWIDGTTLGHGLMLKWAGGIRVTGNTFANTGPYPAILMDHCSDVHLSANLVSNGPPIGIPLVKRGPAAPPMLGTRNGVLLIDSTFDRRSARAPSTAPGASDDQTAIAINPEVPLSSTARPPAALTATAGDQQVWLDWKPAAEASSYLLQRSTVPDGPFTTIEADIPSAHSHDVDLTNGTAYYYRFSTARPATGSKPVSATPFAGGLPAPWRNRDIGRVGLAGAARFTNGVFHLAGSGADIYGNTDAFHFVYQSLTGDCTIVARVAGISDADPWAKAGIMLRCDTTKEAMTAAVLVSPEHGVGFQWRHVTGWRMGNVQIPGIVAPVWLKLTRNGGQFSGYHSADGTDWKQIHSAVTIPMESTILAGLALSSRMNSTLCTSSFDSVTVSTALSRVALQRQFTRARRRVAFQAAGSEASCLVKRGQPRETWLAPRLAHPGGKMPPHRQPGRLPYGESVVVVVAPVSPTAPARSLDRN